MKNIIVSSKIVKDKYSTKNILYDNDILEMMNYLNLSFFPYLNSKFKITKNIKKADGLILLGGGDIYKYKKIKENKLRDEIEKKLFKTFFNSNKPILTICRGFQLMSDLYNIKLFKIKGHVRTDHSLKIKNSRYINTKKLIVNSYHNYCVRKIPKNFIEVARLNDGTIEIAEHKYKKILCLMFHPERKMKSKSLILKSLKSFF